MSKKPTQRMKSRMIVILSGMVAFGFCVVSISLFQLQIVRGAEMQSRALQQQLGTKTIGAERGTIYDANGETLAKSGTVYTVCISPRDLVHSNGEVTKQRRDAVADSLHSILGLDKEKLYQVMEKTNSSYERVKDKVEKPQADEILVAIQKNSLKGITLEQSTRRYYPYGNFAASVLGFTNFDNVGAYGLESYYEKTLAGKPGREVSLRNNYGVNMPMQFEQTDPAQDGNSLVLTIDQNIQHYLEKNLEMALKEHKVENYVAGIVMDVKTGAILAMADKPDFDPNDPYTVFDEDIKKSLEELKVTGTKEEYNEARKKAQYKQWRNKLISDPYEPGSVFKIVTTATGLETGAVNANSSFYCSGYVEVAGHTQRCWIWSSRHQGHGAQLLVDAVKNSCNPAFIDIGSRIGISRFMEFFDNFGLTKGTGIDLPGEVTSIYHHTMTISDLCSSAFGQTFKVTPIQMITAASAAVNGGQLMQPYVVKQVLGPDGKVLSTTTPKVKRQVVSKEVSAETCLMLEQVVTKGSGSAAAIPGYRVGGKTGTSEKLDTPKDAPMRNTLSFFGFAPVDDPQVACLVLVDEPNLGYAVYGSTIAAPIVGSVLADVLPYLGIEPQYSEEELDKMATVTPSLVNMIVHDAEAKLRAEGLKCRVVGDGGKVLRQVPSPQETVPTDGTVVLYTEEITEDQMIEVPDVVGKSPQEANLLIAGAGLNLSVEGALTEGVGIVVESQSPDPKTKVPGGSMVKVRFKDPNLAG